MILTGFGHNLTIFIQYASFPGLVHTHEKRFFTEGLGTTQRIQFRTTVVTVYQSAYVPNSDF